MVSHALPLSASDLQINADDRTTSDHHKFAYLCLLDSQLFNISCLPCSGDVLAIKILVRYYRPFSSLCLDDFWRLSLLPKLLYTWTYAGDYLGSAAVLIG
jgi:hypothetical protein